jgi:peptide/nickel transport system substrate-binding protein
LLLVGLLIILATIQTAWFTSSFTESAPTEGGTYAEGVVGRLDTMNPLFASTPSEISASKLIFSGLLSYDRDNQLRPDVASSWTISQDGKVYTVKLRNDVYWHDGVKLTADDVVFTVRLIQNTSVKAVQYGTLAGVKIEKASDDEVRFVLPSVYSPFAHALTFGILPQHVLGNVKPADLRENEFGRSPIGSGPFVFRQLQIIDIDSDRLVVHMEANSKYYGGSIRLNRFQLHAYEDRTTLSKALITNEINAALGLGADQVSEVMNHGNFVAASSVLLDGMYAIFNNDQPILKDVGVRQALTLATDRRAIISAIHGRGVQLEGPLPQSFVPGEQAVQASFNRAAAVKKLDELGWKLVGAQRQKDGVALGLTVVAPNSGDYKLLLDELSKQWSAIGVKVNVQLADTTTIASDYLQSRTYDVLLYELSIGADPDVYAYWHSSQANAKGLNFANYRSCLLYTSPSPRDRTRSRMPSSA